MMQPQPGPHPPLPLRQQEQERQPPPPPPQQQPQALRLALFELAAELHRSGSGAVFEATDVRSGGRVAIKRKDSSELGERKLLEHEAVLLATLSHPNVAVCLGSFVERGRFYMVLAFVLWYVVI